MESTPSEQSTADVQSRATQSRSIGLRVIKLGVFVVVTTVIALGAYFGVQAFLLSDDTSDDDRRAVAVQRGTLLDDVSASGSVEFPELESLRFDISGSVGELLVEEGDFVTAGQPLIVLDDVTISVLELAIAEAEIDLEKAGEDLVELLGGASDLERATLESAVAKAEIDLQDAGEALAELLSGASDLERAIAASNLTDARVASKNAADLLAEFTPSNDSDSPATAAAKEVLDDANAALADALAAAEDDARSESEKVADAQQVFDDSAGDYGYQLSGWFGSVVTEEDRSLSPVALFEKWNTSVDIIFTESTALVESPVDDEATPWNESVVWVWTHLTPYPILTGCDSTSFTARCPGVEIDDAWDVRVAAQDLLAEVVEDAANAASTQQTLISAAQDAIKAAADDVVETTNDIDIDALAAAFDEAVELEKDAEATLAGFGGPDPLQVNLANTAVNEARAELDHAKEQLADIAAGGLDQLQVNLATTAVNKAKAELDRAKEEFAGTQLVAPFDGVITSISVLVGDPVSRNTPTLDIVDLNVVTVSATVDEIDVLSLRIGDKVAVVLDALSDQTLDGTVEEIGDGINQQGVIEFPLTIALTPPDGVELIEGLSATATIVINQIDNALLIPLQSVSGSFAQPTVDVVTGDSFVTTAVTLGASDDFWVIVESGLAEGQQVLMEVVESVDPFQQFFGGGGIRIPGGARFGGGGGGRGFGGGQGGGDH